MLQGCNVCLSNTIVLLCFPLPVGVTAEHYFLSLEALDSVTPISFLFNQPLHAYSKLLRESHCSQKSPTADFEI